MRRWSCLALMLLLSTLVARPVLAQTENILTLRLNRDWGYGGFGQIQGLFSMSVTGPDDLARVVFMIDGQAIGEDTATPFKVQFTTDAYQPGMRTMSAAGFTREGTRLDSNEITAEFVTAGAAGESTTKAMAPLLGLVGGLLVVMTLATVLSARKRTPVPFGQPRSYGLSGGTICPKCARPFALSLLGFNLGVGKLTACPHCGKWSVVRRWPLDALRAAEEAELARAAEGPLVQPLSDEERLRQDIEGSRYADD